MPCFYLTGWNKGKRQCYNPQWHKQKRHHKHDAVIRLIPGVTFFCFLEWSCPKRTVQRIIECGRVRRSSIIPLVLICNIVSNQLPLIIYPFQTVHWKHLVPAKQRNLLLRIGAARHFFLRLFTFCCWRDPPTRPQCFVTESLRSKTKPQSQFHVSVEASQLVLFFTFLSVRHRVFVCS